MPTPEAFTVTLNDGRTLNWTVDATVHISEHNFYIDIFDPQPEEQPMPTTTPLDTVVRHLQHSWIGTASTPVRGEDLRALVDGSENPPLYLMGDEGPVVSGWYLSLDGATRDMETRGHLAPYAHVLDQLIDMDATVISRPGRSPIDVVHQIGRYFVHYTIEPDGDSVYGSARVWFENGGRQPWQLLTWSGPGLGNHDSYFSTEVQRRWLDEFIDSLCIDCYASERIAREGNLRERFLATDNTVFDMWSLLDDESDMSNYEPLYL